MSLPSNTPLNTHKRAVIIGASAGIGAALARELAAKGYIVALLARRVEAVQSIAEAINAAAGETRAFAYKHDATDFDSIPALFQEIHTDLKGIDTLIYNAGVMPFVEMNEFSFEKDKAMLDVNTLGAMAWCGQAAAVFERLGAGQIVGISSVAGDRGRVKNPGYNASKAGFDTYLEALRNRLDRHGINVLTVRPGPVDTEMTKEVGGLMMVTPEKVAADITKAIIKRRQVLYSPWPLERLSRLENYGHSMSSAAYLFRPTHPEQIGELLTKARATETPITLRGSGRSYGDASLNAGGVVVDIRRMNRILEWNPETGVIKMEAGVTIEQLWKYILEDGWWPPVVPGTMFPTIGGVLGVNIHGKNNWQAGTFGEHVIELTAMLTNGDEITLTPKDAMYYNVVSSLGMLGIITTVTMQMKKIHSGSVRVSAWAEPDLESMMAATDRGKDENNYIVGWMDSTKRGKGLGRGQMHAADYLAPGDDPAPTHSLKLDSQVLPDTFFGLVPKSILYKFMRPFMNNLGVWGVNTAKYFASATIGNNKTFLQSHIAFNFLLDYVPNWELSYGRGGLIQYQCFIPKETAHDAFAEILKREQKRGLPNYLSVLKRHRPDKFLLSHAVDGYSLAQDFKITDRNKPRMTKLVQELDQIVLEAGGRFYFAKDSTLRPEVVKAFLGDKTLKKLHKLKAECDPQGILESDLYRRCFK
jgi:short-subunit dehydrogenase